MRTRDIISAKAIALATSVPDSNSIAYLGRVFFPFDKKMGMDLKWLKTHKNLPVTLKPSAFDVKAALRSREGFNAKVTEMAFFREGMLVKEKDEQEILRIKDSTDPYAQDVIDSIFDDANTLLEGARVVPERMVWQLLAPKNGKPAISIIGNGAEYAYDYDPDNSFVNNNFVYALGSSNWNNPDSDPIGDLIKARRLVKGTAKPTVAVMNSNTMSLLLVNNNVKNSILTQNVIPNIVINEDDVVAIIKTRAKLDVIVYDKLYADEDKTEHSFYPDGMVTLLPNAPVGKTWFGTTPEERAALSGANADFALVDGVFSVQVSETVDPVNTKTIASEIVLPSFEGMDSVVVMNVGEVLDKTLTGTVAEGSASGTTKVTLDAAPSGYAYKVSTTTDSLDKIFYGTDLSGWADYTSGDNIVITDGKTFAIALVDSTNKLAVAAGLFVADSAT